MNDISYQWLSRPMMKYKRILLEIVVATFFMQLLSLVSPLYFQVIIDKIIAYQATSTLYSISIIVVIVVLFEIALTVVRHYIFCHTTKKIYTELFYELLHYTLKLPAHYFDNTSRGTFITNIKDLEKVIDFVSSPNTLALFASLSFSAIFLIAMLFYSVPLTLIVVFSIALQIIISSFVTPTIRQNSKDMSKNDNVLNGYLMEAVNGLATVKATHYELALLKKWSGMVSVKGKARYKSALFSGLYSQLATNIGNITTLVIMFYGALLIIGQQITTGEFIAFFLLSNRITAPAISAIQYWRELQENINSARNLSQFFKDCMSESHEENSEQGYRQPMQENVTSVRFRDVNFQYPNTTTPALQHINLQVQSGQVVALVGHSGSGKSTLLKLLQDFYQPNSGSILINNRNLSSIENSDLRRMVGVVPQDTYLFKRSVLENIALSDDPAHLPRVQEVAKLTGIHDFIEDLPQGYFTSVAEFGSNLSGGQKQRISIARALFKQPQILLMDEPTSGLDHESESVVHENLASLTSGMITFIAAHRLATIEKADLIISMEDGKIVAQGSHQELMRSNAYYAKGVESISANNLRSVT